MKNKMLSAWLQASRLSNRFNSAPSASDDAALRQEFEDLFMGTNASIYIPLWASVCKYEDGSLLDKTTLKIVHTYHKWGYAPVEMDGNPPDYIAQLLRFVAYLLACALHEETQGRNAKLYLDAADEFISLYLVDTVRVVADGIHRHATRREFLTLADNLIAFCRSEFEADYTETDPAELKSELLCYDSYENGASPAIENCEAKIIYTTGRNNCGGRCAIRATEQDGCIVDLETGCYIGEPTLRACVRGRGYRTTYMNGSRLRYPMKRIGKRGEGRFQRISWEEAADLVAAELKRTADKYGPGSRFVTYGVGLNAVIRPDKLIMRLMNLNGGFLDRWSTYSYNHSEYTTPFIYGDTFSGSSTEDHLNAKLIILWAHNPVETIWSPQLSYTLMLAKEQGAKIIVIDPRQSDSALALADEWIPIAPSSDAALANAMAYVIFEEGLQDQTFMDRCCLGFDEDHMPEGVDPSQNFKNYLFGGIDGVAKSPEWAEKITRVPADTIRRLARLYATTKPACLLPGLGHQRTGNGEQAVRALCALPCLTGNIGIPGGFAGGIGFPKEETEMRYPVGDRAYPGIISCFTWMQAIEDGANMTRQKDHVQGVEKLETNVKLIFTLASNVLINQHSDINHSIEVLQDESKCEFIVGSDVFMTASMKFVDLLLPAPTFLEEDNISYPWLSGHYLLHSNQVVKPLFGCRTEYDWIGDVARRMGLWDAWSAGHEKHTDWLRDLYNGIRPDEPELPPYEEFKAMGGYSYKNPRTYIAYVEECKDPEKHPFSTPSGKIEIYSKQLRDFGDPVNIPPLPAYIPCPDGPEDPLREKYPLQLVGFHTKRRCHSIHDNNPRLEEVDPQRLWIHPEDAAARSLTNGQLAEVYNDRGVTRIPVFVTERIMRGVVAMAQGAWYTPDENGVDTRGSINVLTSSKPSPLARANPQHTNLVEVKACSK